MIDVEKMREEVKKYGASKVAALSDVPTATVSSFVYKGSIPRLDTAQKIESALKMLRRQKR